MPLARDINNQLDGVVEATPADRDRFVDFLRVLAIGVVVVWHWVLSITQREDGALVMPNPIDVVPGGELLTWLLQIMPLFFFVGGFANLAGWASVRRAGGGAREFLTSRTRRLLLPPLALVVAWSLFELLAVAVVDDHRSVLDWGTVVFMPLWFLGVYLWVVLLVPLTARAHRHAPFVTVLALAGTILLLDVGRFAADLEVLGLVNSAIVWVFAHQLGYFYRDGTLAAIGARGQAALAAAAVLGLVATTQLTVYPASLVATREMDFSHMFPTTGGIALAAVLQAGVVMMLRPWISRWLRRRRVWKAVVAGNMVVLTVFLWHMTAKVAFLGVYEAMGLQLLEEPTARWWLQRPLWLIGPAVLLVPLVAFFAPLELQQRGGRIRDR